MNSQRVTYAPPPQHPPAQHIIHGRRCFICGCAGLCEHREPAVMEAEAVALWTAHERWLRAGAFARKPVASVEIVERRKGVRG